LVQTKKKEGKRVLELHVKYGDDEVAIGFEHSLLSLSKWESKHKVPFLSNRAKLSSEMVDYYKCMIVTPGVDPNVVYALEPSQMDELTDYINSTFTASSVPMEEPKYNPEVTTSELIYYWLVGLQIPFQPTETWHLSRLMMLVQITSFKQQPVKKQRDANVMAKWREINEARKKKFGTSG
jgi:hypothetical protein